MCSSLTINRNAGNPIYYSYDAVGNIMKKTDFSINSSNAYGYNSVAATRSASNGWAGPNAVRSVQLTDSSTRTFGYDENGNLSNDGIRTISYNAFNKPTLISTQAGRINPKLDLLNTTANTAQFYYDSTQLRYKQVKQKSGDTITTVYIGKLYEEETIQSSSATEVVQKSYIDDIAVVRKKTIANSTNFEIGFFQRDRLGSMTAVIDEQGAIVESHSFDVFGRPRDLPMSDKDNQVLNSGYSNRGFTDHEHLDDSQIVHMNGRIFDYNLGRFMSVDPFIQDPGNSQSMNPYSYIMNNPLAGTDPSGYQGCAASRLERVCSNTSSQFGGNQEQVKNQNSALNNKMKAALLSSAGNGSINHIILATVSRFSVTGLGDQGTVNQVPEGNLSTSGNQQKPDLSKARNTDELLAMVKGEEYVKPEPPNLTMTLNGEKTTELRLPDGGSAEVFSGTGDHVNNPDSTAKKGAGPLPKGFYYIVERQSGGPVGQLITWAQDKDEWFALYRSDGKIDDVTSVNGVDRGLFRMHSGTRSAGCVTFKNSEQYSKVRNMLLRSTNSTIPNTNQTYYGTLTVE